MPAFLTNPALIRVPKKQNALATTSPRKRIRTIPCMRRDIVEFVIPSKCLTPELKEKYDQLNARPEKKKKPISNPSEADTPKTIDDAVELVRRHLGARVDVVMLGIGSTNRFRAALQSHHRRFNALVLAPTKMSALLAVAEIGEFSGSCRVIPVVGRGPHKLANPARTAMFQNNTVKGAVVIATPRALCADFFKTGQGPKWLSLVERLVIYDPEYMYDIGSLNQLTKILKFVPPTARRQTVVITAEFPGKNASKVMLTSLRNNRRFIRWPADDETPASRAMKISRRYAITGESGLLAALGKAIEDAMEVPNHKIVVFMTNTKFVQLYASIWRRLGYKIEELHAKRSNAGQMEALLLFAESESSIMFSTEMSAQRASDMKVTHVIEFGAPITRSLHERRVSVAKPGVGTSLLLIPEFERDLAFNALGEDTVKHLSIASCYMNYENQQFMDRVHRAFSKTQWQLGAAAYMSYISSHSHVRKTFGWTKEQLVERANNWCRVNLGAGPWAITPKMADRFQLWKTPGVEVDANMVKLLSTARIDGQRNVDHSLDNLDPRLGPRGKNAVPRRLKPKKLKLGDTEAIMKKVKEDELRMIEKLNRKSPEGRKYLALIAQKAIQRELGPKKGEAKRKKKELEEKMAALGKKKKKSRMRLRVADWAPKFADKE